MADLAEVTTKLEELKAQHQEKIASVKKEQAEKFQQFKKKLGEDAEALRSKNLKEMEEFKIKAKRQIDELLKRQEEEDEKAGKELEELEKSTRATLTEELKAGGKENDEEAKKEVEKKVKEASDKKDQEFDLKQLAELYALKFQLLEEEEKLQQKLQASVRELQTSQQSQEHANLKENLIYLQDTLEGFHDEEVALQKELAPVANGVLVNKFKDGIEQMIKEKEEAIEKEKASARKDHEERVKKLEAEAEKPASPRSNTPSSDPKEDKRKDFLMKKFNLQAGSGPQATSEVPRSGQIEAEKEYLESQLAELTKELEDFKLEKQKLVEDQKQKTESKYGAGVEESKTAKEGLTQTHKARLDKLQQFQKEEKERLESKLSDLDKQLGEKWVLERKKLKDMEEEEKQAILNPSE